MPSRWWSIVLCLLMSVVVFNAAFAAAEEERGADYDEAFVGAAFDKYSLQSAVQVLVEKRLPVPVIIEQAQRAGHRDGRITGALLQSNLSTDQVIINAMQSHMAPRQVLKSLDDAGVSPEQVLELLIENKLDMNRVFSTCRYMLESTEYTKAELVEALAKAGADRPIFIKAERRFDIPPAITVEVYEKVHGEPAKFGHVYTRHSLPQPARIAVGVARIHNSDAFKGRDVISPKSP